MLSVRSYQESHCVFCGKKGKCLEIEMDDGSMQAVLCKTHFYSLLSARSRTNGSEDHIEQHVDDDESIEVAAVR